MPRGELTREAVLKAIEEFDSLGRDSFLDRYGFNGAREYFLVHQGKTYDSKAIAAVANKWALGGGGALTALELSGGRTDAAKRLEALGFELTSPEQNSDWSWDEHVLALDLYMTNPASPPGKQSRAVAELSALLRSMGRKSGTPINVTYRNANGVYMKMMNLRRLDPAVQAQGKSGLRRGSKGEEEVWNRFAGDLPGLRQAAQRIKDEHDEDGEPTQEATRDPVPNFASALANFKRLIAANQKGAPFVAFDEGVAAAHESYKPRLRAYALELLAADGWDTASIGSGKILEKAIAAVEIQDDRVNLTNNLVFWQNRYGHANRDHRALLDARHDRGQRRDIEQALYDMFRGDASEGAVFDRLSALIGAKYPLAAYFWFLKDSDRFLPIQPTGFDQAFRELGINLVTLRQCNWDNYSRYNHAIAGVRGKLGTEGGIERVRLIDAHSFCWMLVKLPQADALTRSTADAGRYLGARAKAIVNMRLSIEKTVRTANGQEIMRTLKNKDLLMEPRDLERLIEQLLDVQENRCALTGIPLQFEGDDSNFRPSADRIDSQGHYSRDNLQIVCRFINFWKRETENEEFKRLLARVRSDEQ